MPTASDIRDPLRSLRSSKPRSAAYLLYWAGVILFVLTCAGLIWALATYTQTVDSVDHTYKVSLIVQQLISKMTDAETGQRGFVITGDDSYLEPYRRALATVDDEVRALHGLTAGNARQGERLNRFSKLSDEKFAEMGETIRLRREKGEDFARDLVAGNHGKNVMDQLRALTADIRAEAEGTNERQLRQWRHRLFVLIAMVCGSMVLGVCCCLIARRLDKQDLRESEERFSLMANFIPPIAWMADKTGWIFWYNQRWYDYTGKTRTEMAGLGWDCAHNPEGPSVVLERWATCIAAGEPFQMELGLRGTDGLSRIFLTRVTPWRDQQGNIFRWFGTNTDIDDLTTIRKELRNSNEKLDARIGERTAELVSANRELEAFAYSVSHDLRAPLRHLDGFAELLRKNCFRDLDAQGQRYLDKIATAAQRMGRLIDDLLAFSRLLRTNVSRTRVDLRLLYDEVRIELEPDLAGRTVVWTIGDLPDVRGDRSMLRQVFVNLLSNAVKYTRDRPEAHIEIGCEGNTEKEMTLFVRDNGVGFEMQYVGKLFEVFQRLHSDEFEGTGVGLANVRRIVERHGGRVWAEGAVDQGASFYCTLQLNRGQNYEPIPT